MAIDEFTPEVCEKIGYYVYRLIDPRNGETFYIGKGKGNRVFQHAAGRPIQDQQAENENSKLARIHSINAADLKVIHLIHRHGLTEREAFHVEGALIDAFPGLTNLQNGVGNSSIGVMHADAVQRCYSAEVFEVRHKLILLTLKHWFIADRGIYEGCRGVWKMSIDRARKAELVLPVLDGVVVDAFVPQEWLPATAENFPRQLLDEDMPSRIGFSGVPASEEVRALYVGRRPPPQYLGARFPSRYTY